MPSLQIQDLNNDQDERSFLGGYAIPDVNQYTHIVSDCCISGASKAAQKRHDQSAGPSARPSPLPSMDVCNWRQTLCRRKARNLYNGGILGCKVCIDNLGWVFDEDTLQGELTALLDDLETIKFATGEVNGQRYSAG